MPELQQLEGVAWPMVTQRPANLLSRRFESWDALFADAARQVQTDLGPHGPLAQRRWGERNTAAICHPLARALPAVFKRWLCMPPDELPGDAYMPRVAAPDFGASERMVVSPGHEADGIIEMPGGQSGNPLSPFWGAGHAAWVHGEATPFLPGPAAHVADWCLRAEGGARTARYAALRNYTRYGDSPSMQASHEDRALLRPHPLVVHLHRACTGQVAVAGAVAAARSYDSASATSHCLLPSRRTTDPQSPVHGVGGIAVHR